MKVLIVGLGMIGASYAKGLTNKGYTVYGVSRRQSTVDKALKLNIISKGSLDIKNFINEVDLIVLAVYPELIKKILIDHQLDFKKGQIITDVAGVKAYIKSLPKIEAEFVGSHPMAGSEKSGINAMDLDVFKEANFIITPFNNSDKAILVIEKIAKDLGFGCITRKSPEEHDQMIAFTSQLTHAIAVALVNTDNDLETPKLTGDSYRDLTRIAMINEDLWSELFISNKTNLLNKINEFEIQLDNLKETIRNDDIEKLKDIFKSAKEIRKRF